MADHIIVEAEKRCARQEAEKLIALGYEFHYHTIDGIDLFRKKVVGLD